MQLAPGELPSSSSCENPQTQTQKVWFGSVKEIQEPGAISPPFSVLSGRGGGLPPSGESVFRDIRAVSCDSPFLGTVSSRLSMGSDIGDPNLGLFGDYRRNSRGGQTSGGKHLNAISHRRQMTKVSRDRMLQRSSSESEVHNTTHSDAGSVTPGGVSLRIRPGMKEFSTPNSGAPRPILSGEPGGFDWGTSTATNAGCLQRLIDLVDSYDIPPGGDFHPVCSIKPTALRRHRTMDERYLSRPSFDSSPPRNAGNVGRAIIDQDAFTPGVEVPNRPIIGEMPPLAITPTDSEGAIAMELAAGGGIDHESCALSSGSALIDDSIIAAARKALLQACENNTDPVDYPMEQNLEKVIEI